MNSTASLYEAWRRIDVVPQISAVAIDCADPLSLGQFWQQLLGGDLRFSADGDAKLHGPAVRIDFVRVPDPLPVFKNRLHLDLEVPAAGRQEAVDRAVSLGATPAGDVYDGDQWQVLRDPENNEFCIVWAEVS
ncbi:VOC family protein [Kribbella sp. CA-293567]|uniref:VOC family protein n=1 Tax=Kribbella sp. CA-293567 TaxID=3002436 RepID=UPI0022DD8072|nr:VOC family protein [Kribbella sp. CA-293567]WBQ03444.1 VOC family protein [Kribbella sp. CA-293567]